VTERAPPLQANSVTGSTAAPAISAACTQAPLLDAACQWRNARCGRGGCRTAAGSRRPGPAATAGSSRARQQRPSTLPSRRQSCSNAAASPALLLGGPAGLPAACTRLQRHGGVAQPASGPLPGEAPCQGAGCGGVWVGRGSCVCTRGRAGSSGPKLRAKPGAPAVLRPRLPSGPQLLHRLVDHLGHLRGQVPQDLRAAGVPVRMPAWGMVAGGAQGVFVRGHAAGVLPASRAPHAAPPPAAAASPPLPLASSGAVPAARTIAAAAPSAAACARPPRTPPPPGPPAAPGPGWS
jgi:hypothetical protein